MTAQFHSGDSSVTRSLSADQLTTETSRLAELLICFWFRRQKGEKNAQRQKIRFKFVPLYVQQKARNTTTSLNFR